MVSAFADETRKRRDQPAISRPSGGPRRPVAAGNRDFDIGPVPIRGMPGFSEENTGGLAGPLHSPKVVVLARLRTAWPPWPRRFCFRIGRVEPQANLPIVPLLFSDKCFG
jgi:hypothetical protein